MKEASNEVRVEAAVVTDRGLSEKRPLNEDSFLADEKRRIFAVADGVGGAQAGEVASRTAMEVLDEAFRHQVDGADIEDLMEVAIQRANASIHRMAQEHPKLSMMATTVVVLHLDGHRATIGHVGDSRLYRLTPDGLLHRETRDHSVVEEEVRAGRMTQEQAAHHPSRNVISRALGAEDGVEVDMNTLEVEDGTAFLLCSDGITRHIPDNELRELLADTAMSLEEVCDEMKRRCYERGAEDNLTAVIVRIGVPHSAAAGNVEDMDRTIDPLASAALARTLPGNTNAASATETTVETAPVKNTFQPASRIAFPAPEAEPEVIAHTSAAGSSQEEAPAVKTAAAAPSRKGKGTGGRFARALILLILGVAAGAAAAHYGKLYYQKQMASRNTAVPEAAPSPSPVIEDAATVFDRKRSAVDRAPSQWLMTDMPSELAKQNKLLPMESTDPEFLYLYGRALLLTGKSEEADDAFAQAAAKEQERHPAERTSLSLDARIGRAAAALKTVKQDRINNAINSLNEAAEKKEGMPATQQ
jgi:serine/threonine protein phosphatase PrpC